MKVLDPRRAAAAAEPANPNRPATSIVYDVPDVRLVAFRLRPGQAVRPHRNASSVILTVIAGHGVVSGAEGEREIRAGEVVCYEPNEVHGMRATDDVFQLLAAIAPRPRSNA